MTNLLLFLILVLQIVSLFILHKQAKLSDLSKEDEAVKLATAEVKSATDAVKSAKKRIPSDK